MTRIQVRPRPALTGLLALLALAAAACSNGGSGPAPVDSSPAVVAPGTQAAGPPGMVSPYSKVMIIVEENKTYAEAMGHPDAPYLSSLARGYGLATAMQAGYPAQCPSLAAYVLLTSGSDRGICDDRDPADHRLTGDNLFSQVAASGQEWRSYAEAMPANCSLENSGDGRYLVRHVPATYYVGERARCATWTVPLGIPAAGALHDDVGSGRLPAFSMITPDACNDMHGGPGCGEQVPTGDSWLSAWMPKILASPDYRSGRLVVLITWDEGTHADNHIPTLVVSPSTRAIRSATGWTHCSTLRTTEEILGLPLLGCAARAPSMRAAFNL